jgi:hypothetical protein
MGGSKDTYGDNGNVSIAPPVILKKLEARLEEVEESTDSSRRYVKRGMGIGGIEDLDSLQVTK